MAPTSTLSVLPSPDGRRIASGPDFLLRDSGPEQISCFHLVVFLNSGVPGRSTVVPYGRVSRFFNHATHCAKISYGATSDLEAGGPGTSNIVYDEAGAG